MINTLTNEMPKKKKRKTTKKKHKQEVEFQRHLMVAIAFTCPNQTTADEMSVFFKPNLPYRLATSIDVPVRGVVKERLGVVCNGTFVKKKTSTGHISCSYESVS